MRTVTKRSTPRSPGYHKVLTQLMVLVPNVRSSFPVNLNSGLLFTCAPLTYMHIYIYRLNTNVYTYTHAHTHKKLRMHAPTAARMPNIPIKHTYKHTHAYSHTRALTRAYTLIPTQRIHAYRDAQVTFTGPFKHARIETHL